MPTARAWMLAAATLAALAPACDDEAPAGGAADAGARDAATIVFGGPDASSADAAGPDAGPEPGPDAGEPDAGPPRGWSVVSTGNVGGRAISGSGPDDVWVVRSTSELFHWNGIGWAPFSAPGFATPLLLNAVWGELAAGEASAIVRWVGAAWSKVSAGTTGVVLNGIYGTSARDVWVVGFGGTILHEAGGGFGVFPSPTSQTLTGVWAVSESEAWAVGVGGTVLRFDGSDWSTVASFTTQSLNAIHGCASNNIWAVGDGGAAIKWDGVRWYPVQTGTSNRLTGVWCAAQNRVWTVGDGPVRVWEGTGWGDSSEGPSDVHAVWAPSADEVWFAGEAGVYRHLR